MNLLSLMFAFTLPAKSACPHMKQGLRGKYYPQGWRFQMATQPVLACEGKIVQVEYRAKLAWAILRRRRFDSTGITIQRKSDLFYHSTWNIPKTPIFVSIQ